MPTYAYACTTCDHRFEVQQSFSDDALTECPECSGRLRKLFNAVGIVFKGSGFYRTDSRGTSKSGAAKASGDSSSAESAAKSSSNGSSSNGSSSASPTSGSASSPKPAASPAA